jgi:hypothetical protein
MDWKLKIVNQLPLDALWNDAGPIEARQGPALGDEDIRALLAAGPLQFIEANIASPLRWLPPASRFDFWKEKVQQRLVAPDADVVEPWTYPEGYCYYASKWTLADESVAVLLEVSH